MVEFGPFIEYSCVAYVQVDFVKALVILGLGCLVLVQGAVFFSIRERR